MIDKFRNHPRSYSIVESWVGIFGVFSLRFQGHRKQDSRALLSSLRIQLSDHSDIFCDTVFSLYSAHNRGSEQPTVDSLIQRLKEMLTVMGQVPIYLVIDALNECSNASGIPSPREMVLELVKEIVELGPSKSAPFYHESSGVRHPNHT